ncbi:MAG: PAS domain S-box protein [Sedimentisphaerales bacterium]|nr:PAS domain S-box protein [Sedimentisphaerales bacterium]
MTKISQKPTTTSPSNIFWEFVIILLPVVIGTVIAIYLDAFDHMVQFFHQHEDLEFDEYFVGVQAVIFGLAIFSIRRWLDTRRHLAHRRTIENKLRLQTREFDLKAKQIQCIYDISNLTSATEIPLEELLKKAVQLTPSGYEYPEHVNVRIQYKDKEFLLRDNFDQHNNCIAAEIIQENKIVGKIEVCGLEPKDSCPPQLVLSKQKLLDEIADRLNNAIARSKDKSAVKDSRERLQGVMASVPNAICVLDLKGRFTMVNQSATKLTYYLADELIGQPVLMLFEEQFQDDVKKHLEDVRNTGNTVSQLEIELVRRISHPIFVSINLSPLYEKGLVNNIVMTIEDITERKKLESQLLQAQKLEAIGQLASGVAHEINTPTQYVGDNTQFLQEAFADLTNFSQQCQKIAQSDQVAELVGTELQELAQQIDLDFLLQEIPQAIRQSLEGIDQIAQIVRAMKDFAHPGKNAKTNANLEDIVQNSLTVSKNIWKNVAQIKLEFEPDLPEVFCLPSEIGQVVLNLVINAVDAIEEDLQSRPNREPGHITISARQQDQWTQLTFTDNGPGIPPNIQSKIFEPFFTTKAIGKGSGQGLAIVRSIIVDKHQGKIHLESNPNTGTTFVVSIPTAPENTPQNQQYLQQLCDSEQN